MTQDILKIDPYLIVNLVVNIVRFRERAYRHFLQFPATNLFKERYNN